jgi:predicted lipoprotein with Yx(FWY)xxD motif
MTMRRAFALALVVAALAAAVTAPAAMSTNDAASPTLQVKSSRFGKLLFDGRGFVLYAFTRDRVGGRSTCYGDCADAWPPYVLKGKRSVALGLKQTLLGTTKRRDGKLQVTYAGRPLYYYRGDAKPGDIFCQDVSEYGGRWLVVASTGKLVR